nr:Chain B, NFAT [synthetic construct]
GPHPVIVITGPHEELE